MTLRPREPYEHPRFRILRGNPKSAEERLAFLERELRRRPTGTLVLGGPHEQDCGCFVCERQREASGQLIKELLSLFPKKEKIMPHYADGSEAKVGDQVTGKLYNSEGIKADVIISITPGAESCNAQVQFQEAKPIVGAVMPEAPRMAAFAAGGETRLTRIVKGEQHGSVGPEFVVFTCVDYSATNELTKVG